MASSNKIAGIFALFLIILVPLVGGAPQSFAPTTFHSLKAVPASNLPPLDPAWVIQQDFDGDLNQSVIFAKNASLVPYRVDVNVTGLNQTANRLANGNFASGTGGWQVPSSPGKNFSWNQSGPEDATSLQANFTGLWNSTLAYPLNDTTHIDQFDEISKWNTYTDNINVTSEIDSLNGIGTTGNYLNISWWKDRISGLNSGEDWGGASRSFFYNGSSLVNKVKIEFPYQTYFDDLIFPGTFAANIKANITITNPLGISKTIPNVVDKSLGDSFTGVSNYWFDAEITSGLESIFNCTGDYTISFDVNITQSIGDVNPYIANMKSRFLVDNLSLIVNSSIGTFNAGEATNASQVVNLGQSVTNDTRLDVSVCAAAVPPELNHTNIQLGCAIDNQWFNLTADSNLALNTWVLETLWISKTNFTAQSFSFQLGVKSFNASTILPNETLLVYFANVSLTIPLNATAAQLGLGIIENTKDVPLSITEDNPGVVGATIDYSEFGGFGLGTGLQVYLNTSAGGAATQGYVTVWAWTWREALWHSLNDTIARLETYASTLPSAYAALFSQAIINFSYINFARAIQAGNWYLARTYASQIGPNAYYTTSTANASINTLWSTTGIAFSEGDPSTVIDNYLERIYTAQQTSTSITSILQGDPNWSGVAGNASLAQQAIWLALQASSAKVPANVNASILADWADSLAATITACLAGETGILPEPAWANGTSRLLVLGYSHAATANLQGPQWGVRPVLATPSGFAGGAPLLATIAMSQNASASLLYITRDEFQFVAFIDALAGYLAESLSMVDLLQNLGYFLSTALTTLMTQTEGISNPQIASSFTSASLSNPSLSVNASWSGNTSLSTGWLTASLYALTPNAPVLVWEQAIRAANLTGQYSQYLQWTPAALPPGANELYVGTWTQNWTAPILLRVNLWVGGQLAYTSICAQEDTIARWFNVSTFQGVVSEQGAIAPVITLNQTSKAGDWTFLAHSRSGPRLAFFEVSGLQAGYIPWSTYANTIGAQAASYENGGVNNLFSLTGSWGGILCIAPAPNSNFQPYTGIVITKFAGLQPYFAGAFNGTVYLTTVIGAKTFTLSLPIWEGTRTEAIGNLAATATVLSRTTQDAGVSGVESPSAIAIASIAYLNLTIQVPAKPIGNQLDILLNLSGTAGSAGELMVAVHLSIVFLDVVSPAPPISEAIILVVLLVIGSVATGFFVVRWQKFLYLRHYPKKIVRNVTRNEEML